MTEFLFGAAVGYALAYFFGAFIHDLIGTLLKAKKDEQK